MASPYRIPHEVAEPAPADGESMSESNTIVAGLAVLLLATVVRVVAASIGPEPWDAESSLAALVVLAVPVLIWDEIRARRHVRAKKAPWAGAAPERPPPPVLRSRR